MACGLPGSTPTAPGADVPYENRSQVSPHALRKSFGVLMRSVGTPLEDIAEVLNYKDLNTTRNYCAFTDTPQTRKTIKGVHV
jgi:site-specific recombinase XerD